MATDDGPGPLTSTVRAVRKKLAKRRTKKKARKLKRRKRRQNSDARQAADELRKLGEETGVSDRAREIGGGIKRGLREADKATQQIAENQRQQRREDMRRFRDAEGEFADDPAELRPIGPPIDDPDAMPADRNPAVDSFLDRDPDGDERRTGPDRAIGPFDFF